MQQVYSVSRYLSRYPYFPVRLFGIALFISFSLVTSGQDYQWAHSFGDVSIDEASSNATDAQGNVYIAGRFYGTIDFDPSSSTAELTAVGGSDIFLAKYDASGNYLWAKRMGGGGTEEANAVAVDGNGNVLVAGNFSQTVDFDPSPGISNLSPVGGIDGFLAKYNSSGQYLWVLRIGSAATDVAEGVAIDNNDNIYITGGYTGTIDFDPSVAAANVTFSSGGFDLYLAKYSPSGGYLWSIGIGSPNQVAGLGAAVDRNNNIVVTGSLSGTADFDPSPNTANRTNTGGIDIFLAKYDSLGNYMWANNMGGQYTELGYALAIDDSNSTYLTGRISGRVDFDPSPATAYRTSNFAGSDVFLAKYAEDGSYRWALNFGGGTRFQGENSGQGVAVDNAGSVYLTGYFSFTADPDPSANVANITSRGNADIFLAKYTTQGQYLWAIAAGGQERDISYSVALDTNNNPLITGYHTGMADFDPSPAVADPGFSGNWDIFLAKYSGEGSSSCVSVVSDNTWNKSTVITPANYTGTWNGAAGIPAASTFSEPVEIGQPYGYHSINEIENTAVISTGSDISYFRKEFNLTTTNGITARLLTTVDDQAEIYLNGHRLALITSFGRQNFKFPAHDARFNADGTVDNGYRGGDSFDEVTSADLDTLLHTGVNEIIVAVRNLGVSTDKGGFSFRLDLNCADTTIEKKSSAFTEAQAEDLSVYPNPASESLNISTALAISHVRLYDLNGKLIYKEEYQAEKSIYIKLAGVPSGIYLLEIAEVGGTVHSRKIIKL